MAKLDASTRTIQVGNLDYHYSADDFVNAESISFKDSRMNRAWIIHNCGTVLAIVFAEYYAYCEQDAIDAACDADKLDSLLISPSELPDYQTGKDSEGNPEYEGIIYLGNASEPFDSENLDYFSVSADLFRLDPVIMQVIENQSREQAAENLQDNAREAEYPEGYDKVWHIIAYLNNEAEYILSRDRENAAQGHWTVTCKACGVSTQIQKREPVICPNCYGIDIETGPLVQTQVQPATYPSGEPMTVRSLIADKTLGPCPECGSAEVCEHDGIKE